MITAALPLLVALTSAGMPAADAAPQLDCHIGPVAKSYGRNDWLVYSCSDNRSVVIVAKPENPASGFHFVLVPGPDKVDLYGEGVGDKAATKPAFRDLKRLSADDIAILVAETEAAGGK